MTESEYELLLPFVACKSQGGAYEDDAFVGGWRLGSLDARLEFQAPPFFALYVHPSDLEQLDLVAMRHRYSVKVDDHTPLDEWVNVTLRKTS